MSQNNLRVNTVGSSKYPIFADDGTTAETWVVDDQSHLVGVSVTLGNFTTNNPFYISFRSGANRLHKDVDGLNSGPVETQFLHDKNLLGRTN